MSTVELLRERLAAYKSEVRGSDRLPPELDPVLLGLAGEVGSILAAAKKLVRERQSYPTFSQDLEEEFGDTIWYLSALCDRAGIPLEDVLSPGVATAAVPGRHAALLSLFEASARLVAKEPDAATLTSFGRELLSAISAFELNISSILARNAEKVGGAFLPLDISSLPEFDRKYPEEEQLPNEFRIRIVERASGKAHMSLNGVFVGDPLLDNVATPDGYRFHDVFHLANAAVLHWSPVVRSLLKRKRKSDAEVDNTQDSGRAIVVEEGLAAWLFQRAGALNYFDGAKSVPYDILKTIQEFVAPYEVSRIPASAWERSILQGYAAFRSLRERKAGMLIGDRIERTIRFEEI